MKLNNNDDSHNSGLNLLIYNMLLDIESHPAWVCGLKLNIPPKQHKISHVTPCVGVWIETSILNIPPKQHKSHPAWVCGLKRYRNVLCRPWQTVTPCVGVWIETDIKRGYEEITDVTPCVGVWIETSLEGT